MLIIHHIPSLTLSVTSLQPNKTSSDLPNRAKLKNKTSPDLPNRAELNNFASNTFCHSLYILHFFSYIFYVFSFEIINELFFLPLHTKTDTC